METLQLPAWTLISAVRYALGRHSAIVGETADLVRRTWNELPNGTRGIIERDIREHLERADQHWPDPLDIVDNDTWRALQRDLTRTPA
jgi:hypothetical protein